MPSISNLGENVGKHSSNVLYSCSKLNYNCRHRAWARIRRSAAAAALNTTPTIDIGLAVLLLVICRQRMAVAGLGSIGTISVAQEVLVTRIAYSKFVYGRTCEEATDEDDDK